MFSLPDFDEQTADDWDVDMSEYYEPGTGDKDAKDFLKMRLETRRRDGLDDLKGEINGLGSFEQHTKVSILFLLSLNFCYVRVCRLNL